MSDLSAPLQKLSHIKHILLVISGKGGVGKSSITTQLALYLVTKGLKVGVLDIDLTGPSIPRMLGLQEQQVYQASSGWVPVYADENQQLCCMSIGFLLTNKNDSVVWRGPKKNAMIKQFLEDVCWGNLDYLIIDTPPGTSDEHISVVEYLKNAKPDGAIIVTTPQAVSLADVRKQLNFCTKVNLPIVGVIENMSGFRCPHCEECTNLFSTGGGEEMAKEFEVEFLGRVPIDPTFALMVEGHGAGPEYQVSESTTTDEEATTESGGKRENTNSLISMYPQSGLYQVFEKIGEKILAKVSG